MTFNSVNGNSSFSPSGFNFKSDKATAQRAENLFKLPEFKVASAAVTPQQSNSFGPGGLSALS